MPDHDSSDQRVGFLRDLLTLTRARITVMVTLTTATGYFAAGNGAQWDMWLPLLGVLLLASGSSALNQCQESRIDGLMTRTQNRPIPSGRMELGAALFVAVLLILLGMSALTSGKGDSRTMLILGGFAVFWYNGVYTYLKRVTAFAVVPGALIGAVPPIIGYIAAGGDPTDPLILLVASFFFVWQIPHFWLLLLMFGGQYGDAGLPTLTSVFSHQQLRRITFMWVAATAAGGLAFPMLGRGEMAITWGLLLVVSSLWLALASVEVLRRGEQSMPRPPFLRAFIRINAYALVVMTCLSLNALVSSTG